MSVVPLPISSSTTQKQDGERATRSSPPTLILRAASWLESTAAAGRMATSLPVDIGRVVHATTLFSNALIERKGAPTGLITTRGFRDTLEIAREREV